MTDVSSGSGVTASGLPVGDAVDFLRLIWAVDHALQRRSKSMAATLGITGPQRLVIRIIGRFPSIHARQLADILHLHPSSLTAVLKRLERRDLVRRWPDERDRRRWLLGLTRQGQALNRETPGTIEAAVQRVLKTTTRDNLDGTRAVLSKLARELDGGGRSRASGMRR
ncbi:MAG: MarR family transcriptional regulator [Burkholderiales bacterium]|nr:MarR family transcriptional regulator [Burkholderiales bacterium]